MRSIPSSLATTAILLMTTTLGLGSILSPILGSTGLGSILGGTGLLGGLL